jgi:F-type H+-transporting ATPase subunit delta
MPTDKKTQSIVKVLSQFLSAGGNLSQLKIVVNEFDDLVQKESKDNTAIITSAFPLTQEQKDKIQEILNKNYVQNLAFEYQIEASLMAGMKIQIKDYIIDMTLASDLKEMTEKLIN